MAQVLQCHIVPFQQLLNIKSATTDQWHTQNCGDTWALVH